MASPTSEADDDPRLYDEKFDPAAYLRDYLKDVKSGEEAKQLQQLRNKLNAINSASTETLKKNVFISYQQFIDTAKEVSR
ncbi:hypothetical protein AB6A40_010050 [Gnathostoma spinigerum]|uniref:Uncharacterized protein n=1 Tax=Gnathostoma spinigerum TaxID=75299 RepID=A0ABD6EVG6_9BILA